MQSLKKMVKKSHDGSNVRYRPVTITYSVLGITFTSLKGYTCRLLIKLQSALVQIERYYYHYTAVSF